MVSAYSGNITTLTAYAFDLQERSALMAKRGHGEGSIYRRKNGRWTAEISLGHSQIAITMDIYSHVLPTMQEEAMNKINEVFQG